MKKILKKIKGFHKVEIVEPKIKDNPFIWIGSRRKINGGLIWEMNLDTFGVRQIVEISTSYIRVRKYKLFGLTYFKMKLPNGTEMRYHWKKGKAYCQASTLNKATSVFQKYIDELATKLAVIDSISNN